MFCSPARMLAVLALLAAPAVWAQHLAPASDTVLERGEIFNIIDWDGGKLPPLYERSDQLPLSLGDIRKLSDGGFGTEDIVKMVQERRCACDVSADGLIALKKDGVATEVIRAVSLHALPPNRGLRLKIALDFEAQAGKVAKSARRAYLYLILPDGDRERVFVGDLQSILAGTWADDRRVDNTDILLPRTVRRVVFASRVPLKEAGPKEALVFTSTKPDIYTSADIPQADGKTARRYAFDYPASSPRSNCTLQALYRQDAALVDRWHLARSHFDCEWD
jgi:hypothetical protein